MVDVLGPDGTPVSVSEAEAKDLTMAGGHVMSAQEAAQAHKEIGLQQKYGTGLGALEGVAGPLAAGAARGLTFGLSDVALAKLGGEGARQRLQDYNDFNPIEGNAGELAGMVGGSMLGGFGGAAGLAGKIGSGAERLATGALGEGIAGRVIGGALSGAVENGLYEAGKAASDSAIRDEPLTGQKLVAAGLNGALFGGGVGGVLGAASGALARVGSRAERGALESVGAAAEAPQRGTIGEYLSKQSDINTIKAFGGSAGDFRALERNTPGGYRRVAQDLNADIEATTGKTIGFHDKESLHEYATTRKEAVGKKLGELVDQLDQAKTGIAPSADQFASRVEAELVRPKMVGDVVLPGQEKSVRAVTDWVDRAKNAFGGDRAPTFSEWQKMRVGLDKEIYASAAKASPKTETLRQMRAIMEDEFIRAGDKAAETMGTTFRDQYQAQKQLFQSLTKAADLTERGVSREVVNNSFGLRSSMGAIAGVASGSPLLGLAMGAAGKVIKDRGDFMAADLMRRASTMAGVSRMANGVTEAVQSGVRRLVPASNPSASKVVDAARLGSSAFGVQLSGNARADFNKVSAQVIAASSNPAKTTDQISRSMGDLATHAPKTAAAVIQTTLTSAAYLNSLLPPSRSDPYSLQPQFDDRQPSDFEVSKFMRSAQAVDNPLLVLDEAKKGSLSRDHVDAVKAVYPDLYQEMREQIFQNLVSSKKKIPYAKRLQLGILLDLPTDKTLSPDFQRAIQATYSAADQAGAESPPQQVTAPDIAGSAQTATQAAVEGAQ